MSTPGSARPDSNVVLRGILLILISTLIFSANDALVKWLTQHHPVPQLVWARFFFQLLLMLLLIRPSRPLAMFRTQRPGLQVTRGLLALASSLLFVFAVQSIPLADAAAIGMANPLIATLLAVPLLGEPIGIRRILAVTVGFVGVLVILRPGLGVMHPAALFALGVAFTYALFQIVTRKLGPTEVPMATMFYSSIVGVVVMSVVVPFFWVPADPLHWLLMAVMGAVGAVGHYMVVRAYRLAPVGVLSPFGYFQLIASTLLGLLVFGQFPDGWTIVGAVIVTCAGLYVLYRETVRRRERRARQP
jgi:drug/metabolite transporter (DMT)-like permease